MRGTRGWAEVAERKREIMETIVAGASMRNPSRPLRIALKKRLYVNLTDAA